MLTAGPFRQPSAEESDEDLMQQLVGGNTDTLDFLYERHESFVFGIVRALKPSQDDEDIVNIIFTKVWKKRHQYKPGRAPFRAWLHGIARNTKLAYLRAEGRRLKVEGGSTAVDEGIQGAGDLAAKLELEGLIDRVTAKQRVVLQLVRQGFTATEMAKLLGKGVAAVETERRRAIEACRKMLKTRRSEP